MVQHLGLLSLAALTAASSFGAGRQLTGVYAPASTAPLDPAEAAQKMSLPEGFEARIFASEPQVVNPVAMTWDERGRLWVLELYEYPLGAAPGTKPRDQVKILEDTDNDGRADKVTVFVDGLNLATGLALGYGGVFVGQAPDLLFFQDTDGDDKADKRTVLKTGFGLEDRHELLNGFNWGPDGYLYMTQGVFTHSNVKNPNDPNDDGVVMTAAVARYQPRTKKFEVFAEGTSNPWGVDFDRAGNAFVSACVIDHFFHMAAGGIYVRQAGTPPNPYAYELLPSIVDHRHFRAAYAGVQIYQGNQFPKEYLGTVLMGNIHDSAVHQDRLTPRGSSFRDSFVKDFVRANDGWFRPVSTQVGPDGAIWIMDWYDKYPCYQNANADPEGVDRTHGRIWRIVYTGNEKGKAVPPHPEGLNLKDASTADLVQTLANPNSWHRRMAQRILSERQDASGREPLLKLLADKEGNPDGRIAALWTLHTSGQLRQEDIETASKDSDPILRTWAARLLGERGEASDEALSVLEKLGADKSPSVRLAVATAIRQFESDELTIDTRPDSQPDESLGAPLQKIYAQEDSAKDPLIPFMLWMDTELWFANSTEGVLDWYARDGMSNPELGAILLRKGMRRICETGDREKLGAALNFLNDLPQRSAPLTIGALDGLIEGQKGRAYSPDSTASSILAKLRLSSNEQVRLRAQQLGSIWGDAAALDASVHLITDNSKSEEERIQAIQSVKQQRVPAVHEALLSVVKGGGSERVVDAAVSALADSDADDVAERFLDEWKQFSPGTRRIAAQVLSSRSKWAQRLISGIEAKTVSMGDLPPTIIRSLLTTKDDYVRNRATKVIGRYRESTPDKRRLIAEKKKMVLHGPIDIEKGHEIAQKTCFTCHKLHGEGADIGPDLTGVGRSTLDALLSNVIDPNQIIGAGYENVEVTTKDDRTIAGRMVENTDSRVKILSMGPKEEVIPRSEIASVRVSELSVMPEGLEQMPDDDFRNLIWFIYSPPADKKPVSVEEERKEILKAQNSTKPQAAVRMDGESVALWNPEWKLTAPDFEGSPAKLPDYAGKHNVLMTHPFNTEKGASLERELDVPAGKRTVLSFNAAAHEKGDWELRAWIDGKLINKQLIDKSGSRWKEVTLDLTPYAGKRVNVRLENAANGWSWEFGYWNDIRITSSNQEHASIR
jgi:putative membrane-bound dehydrogenase-like protein